MMRFAAVSLRRCGALAVTMLLLAPLAAVAQTPSCPANAVRLTVPWAAGGATDVMARIIAGPLGQRLDMTVVVENKPGAGGTIGTSQFIRERPDGCALLLATSSTNAAAPYLYRRPGFRPVEDFTPIGFVASVPSILVVAANSPHRSVSDLVAAARARPGILSFGSGGSGSSQHLAGALMQTMAQVDIVHIPYRSSAPAITDMIGGHVDLVFDTGSLQHIRAGSVRPLGIAAEQRLAILPDVSTLAEAGYPGFVVTFWGALFGPPGLPTQL